VEEKSQFRIVSSISLLFLALAVFVVAEFNETNTTENSTVEIPTEDISNLTVNETQPAVNETPVVSDEVPVVQEEPPLEITASDKVSQEVIDKINEEGYADVIVMLKAKRVDSPMQIMGESGESLKEARTESLKALKKAAKKSQDEVLAYLNLAADKLGVASGESNFKLGHKYATISAISGKVTLSGLKKLEENGLVKSVTLDGIFEAFLDDSIPQIHANDVWSIQVNGVNLTGLGQTVCIIDTGVDYNHSALGGGWGNKIVDGHRYVTYEFGNNNVDQSCSINNSACYDDHGHGTHVTGIVISGHSTYKGTAPGSKVAIIKALNSTGSGTFSDVAAGMDWCINHSSEYNISVISMSLGADCDYAGGYYCSSTACDDLPGLELVVAAMYDAYDQDILVTIASGNDGKTNMISSPACISTATSVGAVSKADTMYSGTNRAQNLDILAPGVLIRSTYPGNLLADATGTSMATPHVAGAVALLNQYASLSGFTLTSQQVEDVLKENADDIGYDWPRLNVLAAINSLECNSPEPQNSLNCIDKMITYSEDALLNVSANFTGCTITAENITIGSNGTVIYDNVSLNVRNLIVEAGGVVEFKNGGSTVWQNGVVNVSGTLVYNHETVRMNVASDNQFGINVLSGGNLTISNDTEITNGGNTKHYYFRALGGNLSISDSSLSYLGADGIRITAAVDVHVLGNISFSHLNDSAILTYRNLSLTGDLSVTGSYWGVMIGNNGLVLDCQDNTIDGSDAASSLGINVVNKNDTTIQNCILTDWASAIRLYNGTHGLISNNRVSSNLLGIDLQAASDHNTIINNNATSNRDYGIVLDNSKYNNISSNNATSGGEGITLKAYSDNNTVAHNNASLNDHSGVIIYTSSNNTLTDNTISSNNWTGFEVMTSQNTTGNIFSNNTLCSNNLGDGSYYDIYDADSVNGDNNTCDTTYNWNDTDTWGCTHSCSAVSYTFSKTSNSSVYGVHRGENFEYNISVGGATTMLYNVTITDSLNSTLQFISSSPANTTPGLWNLGTVAPGETKTLIITVNGTEYAIDLNNTANMSAIANSTVTTMNDSVLVNITLAVTLNSPSDGYDSTDTDIVFNCSAESNTNLTNITLYGNWTGTWQANETANLTGLSNLTTFTKTLSVGLYVWNCLAYDNASVFGWGNADYELTITAPPSCGDHICSPGETCSSCAGDCGKCKKGGGGGGGGGGVSGGFTLNAGKILQNAALPNQSKTNASGNASNMTVKKLVITVKGGLQDGKEFGIVVTDSEGNPVEGASVVYAGQTTTSGIDGKVTLRAVLGNNSINAAKEGYEGAAKEVTASAPEIPIQISGGGIIETPNKVKELDWMPILLMIVVIILLVMFLGYMAFVKKKVKKV